MSEKWDKRFLKMAEFASAWSKDPSTQCGAVITKGKHIVSLGFNGFPAGTSDATEIYEDRNVKLLCVLHAEANAILSAKQDLTGCTIYVYPMSPCSQCAAMIIQAGIVRVVAQQADEATMSRWRESHQQASRMFMEAGVANERSGAI